MIKYLSLLSISLFLFAGICSAKDSLCPQGIGASAGDKPALIEQLGTDSQLLVCGFTEKTRGSQIYSEFDVYYKNHETFSKSLLNVGALKSFLITKEKHGLSFVELIFFQGKDLPGFKKEIICTANNCTLSAEKCAFTKPATFKTDALATIKNAIGKNADDFLISEVGDLALTGNPEAIKIFEKNPGIKLDGAAAEGYHETQKLIERLKQLKCGL